MLASTVSVRLLGCFGVGRFGPGLVLVCVCPVCLSVSVCRSVLLPAAEAHRSAKQEPSYILATMMNDDDDDNIQ